MTALVQCARQRSRRICFYLGVGLCLALVLSPSGRPRAQEPGADAARARLTDSARERGTDGAVALIAVPGSMKGLRGPRVTQLGASATAAAVAEAEPNDTPAAATPLGVTPVRVRANLFRSPFTAGVDIDVYSFTAAAGDRVYAATITAASAGSPDTNLDILASNGTTVLETDVEDGGANQQASNIAGLVVPSSGTYYARVRQGFFALSGTIRPYDLYVRVHSGAPVAETEPNDIPDGQPLAESGWMSGAVGAPSDQDTYEVSVDAGDTIVAILDADPERDSPEWNPLLGMGLFLGAIPGVNGSATDENPSEAFALTVKSAGTYIVHVRESGLGGAASFTYHLSVSVLPRTPRTCTSYTGTTGAIADLATTDFSLFVPDTGIIDRLRLSLNVNHTTTADLDVSLIAPGGNEVVLFDDLPNTGAINGGPPEIDFILDDDAALPAGFQTIMNGVISSPEPFARLDLFRGQQALGPWTLRVRDDLAANTGTVNSWGLSVCGASAPPPLVTTIFSASFEGDDGGFTHGGTLDSWALGLPTSAPITTCSSGTNCWKTNLSGPYSANSNQDLVSPPIDLTAFPAASRMTLNWAQKYQLESASFDTAYVEVRQVGVPSSARRVWEWTGDTMTRPVGNPEVSVNVSAGWAQMTADISSFAGTQAEIRFHLESNATGQLAGLAIDDVNVERRITRTRSDFNGDGSADIAVYRPSTGQWFIRNQGGVQFGDPSDVPVPGDYNGDRTEDIAVFRPSTGQWFVRNQFAVQFGDRGDVPVPGDFNGDGTTDVAVYRPSTGDWFVRNQFSVNFGGAGGYVPVVGDYNGDLADDVAVFQPSTGMWFVRNQLAVQFGAPGDRPVPGDYDGNGSTDIAVYRPSTGQWLVRNQFNVQFGNTGDLPVPRDYDGNGIMDVAVYRPSTGQWLVMDQPAVSVGDGRDIPIPMTPWIPPAIAGDYDGDGATDIAVHRPSTHRWFVRNQLAVMHGDPGDIPIPADYNGDRRMDVAVYRPSTGHWFVRNRPAVQFGDPSDKPIPGDYNGDGLMDVAVYRPSTGQWFVRNQFAVSFGEPSDIPMPGDYNGDRVTDIAVYRPSTRTWFVRNQLAVQFGDPGDVPVPADYNGDGRMDLAVYRPSTRTWYVRNQFAVQFGDTNDVPVPGDYNGDGLTDIAVYRPSTGMWFVRNVLSVQFGDATYVPMVRIGGPQ